MARLMAWFVVALLVASVASACSDPVKAPGASDLPVRSAETRPADPLERQARDALERWAAAVRESGGASIEFEGELTSIIGEWEDDVAENNSSALDAGLLDTVTDLSEERPGRREVKWVDGSKVDVDVFSSVQALDALERAATADCEECEPLIVTEANLATGLVETSDGPAEVPMWVFSLRDTGVRITRVAVDPNVSVDPPPWAVEAPPEGISIEQATSEAGSKTLEVQFIGANEACDIEYDVEAVESALAVVVIVSADVSDQKPCPADARLVSATVTLDAKLGKREVLEVRQGLPVPVRAP